MKSDTIGKYEKEVFIVVLFIWLLTVIVIFAMSNRYEKVYEGDMEYSSSLLYCIDDISTQNAQISGWCLKPGENINTFDIRIILWSDMLDYGYLIPTSLQKRKDVNAYMDDGYDYENSGFLCKINPRSIKKSVYKVLIQYGCNGYQEVVFTGSYYTSAYDVIYETPEPSEGLLCSIDYISVSDAVIRGWCMEKGKNINSFDMDILLWNQAKAYGYQIPACLESREDITEYFNDGINYDRAGFCCVFDNSWLVDADYRIYIRYRCNNSDLIVDTGQEYRYHTKAVTIHKKPEETKKLLYKLESVDEEAALIRGWCIMPGENANMYDNKVIFWKENQKYGYAVPAYMVSRPDITQKFDDGCNYDQSGFVCDYKDRLPLNGKYQIYIQYSSNDQESIADTGVSINVGEAKNE